MYSTNSSYAVHSCFENECSEFLKLLNENQAKTFLEFAMLIPETRMFNNPCVR